MPTSYTSLLGLALPVTGELAGQWGTTVNDYITQYVDSSVAGTQTISGSQTAVTLSVTNGSSLVTAGSGATGSAQFQIINCTGNPAGLLTITAPASSRQYIIINATSTSQSVKIVGTGPTTGVTILSGEKAHVAWNGSDFVKIATQSGNGSFVDLTVSGSMTLSGGTANGVLYLNGSKVATSGSALTFDGTTFAVTGAATVTGDISTTSTGRVNVRGSGTGVNYDFQIDNSDTLVNFRGSRSNAVTKAYAWYLDNSITEGMRLTSTGLGIGTSSPTSKLTIGTGTYSAAASGTAGLYATVANGLIALADGYLFASRTGSTYALIDSSGNLGLGVTPSAWYVGAGTSKAIQFNASSALYDFSASGNRQTHLINNAYLNTSANWIYLNTDAASRYVQNAGIHSWHTAASGTAGNPISFTQAMTLDASGRLLLGTTTTTNNLRLDEKVAIVGVNVPYNGMALTGYTGAGGNAYRPVIDFNRSRGTTDGSMTVLANNDYLGSIIFRGSDGTSFQDSAMISSEVDGTPGANDMPGRLTFWTSPDGSTTVTERARITSGGDLLVGTVASSSARLYVRGSGTTSATASFEASNSSGATRFYVQDDGTTRFFGSSGSETARITSAGDLLLGGTSTTQLDGVFGQIIGSSSKTSAGLALETQYGAYLMYTDSTDALIFWDSASNEARARIDSNGNFLVGTTTAGAGIGFDVKLAVDAGSGETSIFKTSSSGAYPSRMWNSATTGDNTFSGFLTEGGGTLRGSITYNRAAGLVAYNTTSDYRAKDIIGPVANPGATIDALKVYEGKMKGATQSRPMLVAHEAQDHAPYAVTGEKDAVNEDGTPKYQQMDVSSLVPLLLAEIQSLRARVAQLESKGV